MQRGKFIVIEGIDGSGKSTQIEMLQEKLSLQNKLTYATCEPSDRPIGKLIRRILRKEITTTNDVLAGLYFSDRLDHLENTEDGILMKLRKGITVICDRYYMSSLAYNSLKSPMSWVYDLNSKCMEIQRPDLTLYLDLSVQESLRRINNGRSSTELFEKEDILTKIKNNYNKAIDLLHSDEKIVVINSDQDPELVHLEILDQVDKIF